MGCGVQCCLPEGCVRFTFSQLPMTTSSLFLSARLYVRVSILHPRRESRIPSERSRNDTLLLPSSLFYFLGFFGCSRRRSFRLFSRLSLSSPRWGRKNSTGLTENNIPGKRAERVIIPTKHPPRLGQSLLGVGRSWNSTAVLSPVCWRRLEFAEFLEFPLHSLRACALPSLALC